jgi:PTS system mannose-specific IIA component
MLLRILGMRDQDLPQLAQNAKNAAIQGIVLAGEVLTRKINEA